LIRHWTTGHVRIGGSRKTTAGSGRECHSVSSPCSVALSVLSPVQALWLRLARVNRSAGPFHHPAVFMVGPRFSRPFCTWPKCPFQNRLAAVSCWALGFGARAGAIDPWALTARFTSEPVLSFRNRPGSGLPKFARRYGSHIRKKSCLLPVRASTGRAQPPSTPRQAWYSRFPAPVRRPVERRDRWICTRSCKRFE